MLYSIIQIVAFQALFLLVYDLFLRKETFFNINRAYLLITSLLSLVLPFIQLPELQKVTTKDVIIQLPEVFIGQQSPTDYEVFVAEKVGIVLEQPSMPIWQIILLLGIAMATLIFIVKLLKINKLKSNNPKRWSGEILIVNLLRSNKAFSFFNTIFLGEDIPEIEKRTIYNHELVHVKEKHSFDLLFFELLRILFWFNPLVYIYQYRVKESHEFIADAKAVKQNGKAEYYQSLLHQIFDTNTLSFTNTFFKKSLIKQRITMLQKSKSSRKNLLKYMLLFPLVFAMLVYSSTEVKAQEKEVVEAKINQELTDEELIEIYYNDILKMREEGAKYFEISNYAGFGQNHSERYIKSREDYLKTSAFMRFMVDMMKETKSKNDELTDVNQALYKKITELPHKNYKGYLEWKKTDEAKELWMSNVRDNSLRLVVDDIADKTKEEQQRFDGLMKQLETDSYYKKLIITDGRSTLVVDSPLLTEENEIAEVPFNVIDESPTIKSCQDLATNDERKQCFSEYINKHVINILIKI
jgi:beta-lactamase regulating signal transducer with metallopeptidase domain